LLGGGKETDEFKKRSLDTELTTIFKRNLAKKVDDSLNKKERGKILATLLSVVLILSCMPSTVAFAGGTSPSSPAISPDGGTFDAPQSVTINNIPDGDSAYYTTNSSSPNTGSNLYSGSFMVNQSEWVCAAIYDPNSGLWSVEAEAYFTVPPVTDTVGGLTLNQTSATMWANSQIGIDAEFTPTDATDQTVTWTSSDTGVVTVASPGSGYPSRMVTLTAVAPGSATITATSEDGGFQATCTVTVGSGNSGSGGGGGVAQPVNNTGSSTIAPATGGTVWLGSDVSLTIPAGALQGTSNVNVTIQQDTTPPATPSGYMLLGSVYQCAVSGSGHGAFNSPGTMIFHFDPSRIPTDENPAVFYYDGATNQWVDLKGTVDWTNDTIVVTVDQFTKYAVMAAPRMQIAPAAQSFSDVLSSYWAYDAISSLGGKRIVSGYPDRTFRPDASITRAEFATMLTKAWG
jgi:uncharacterized protein YjdB